MQYVVIEDNRSKVKVEHCILLSSMEDFLSYCDLVQKQFDESVQFLMRSGVRVDRWDHMTGALSSAPLIAAIGMMPLAQESSLWILASDLAAKLKAGILSCMNNGHLVVVTPSGSYRPVRDDVQILEKYSEPRRPSKTVPVICINNDTRILNLENDADLEPRAMVFMRANDPNYSYLANMRRFGEYELQSKMKEFVRNGGQYLYVYTTAIDTDQMKMYIDAAIRAGIKKFIFEWSTRTTPTFTGFHPLDYIIDGGYSLQVVENLSNAIEI